VAVRCVVETNEVAERAVRGDIDGEQAKLALVDVAVVEEHAAADVLRVVSARRGDREGRRRRGEIRRRVRRPRDVDVVVAPDRKP
jgi:hypothetical protein